MKITKYIGALAFVAMLAACSNEEEQGINTLSNVVEVTANVGKNSIFTRSNPVGKTEEALSVFNDGDLIRILTNGKTVNYTKSGDNWIPEMVTICVGRVAYRSSKQYTLIAQVKTL